jgi:hypothetical protein
MHTKKNSLLLPFSLRSFKFSGSDLIFRALKRSTFQVRYFEILILILSQNKTFQLKYKGSSIGDYSKVFHSFVNLGNVDFVPGENFEKNKRGNVKRSSQS